MILLKFEKSKTKGWYIMFTKEEIMSPDHVFNLSREGSSLKVSTSLLREVNNDMVHNYYWLVRVRVVCDGRVFRSRFVVWHDVDDVCDYFERDSVTKSLVKKYAGEIAGGPLSFLGGDGGNEFTRSGWGVFVEWCNNTICDYNGH